MNITNNLGPMPVDKAAFEEGVKKSFMLPGYKEDSRPQRGWWAPGSYMNKCVRCGEGFIGDKRAVLCADCAYKEIPT